MDPADHSSFSGKATYSNSAVAAAEGTKADHGNRNFDPKNQGDKWNHRGHQEELRPAGDTEDSHQVIIKEIEDLPLYTAALKGDLNEIRNKDPKALSSPVTDNMETPLHVAIQTSRSIHFIRQLVGKLPAGSLLQKNRFGNTALHNAAIAGNATAARIMVDKNSDLPQIKNNFGDTARRGSCLLSFVSDSSS